jgi:hypothetical protein
VDTLQLLPTHRTEQIQVRVSEIVRMTNCKNCFADISSANGTLSVYDIRVKADECYVPNGETTSGVDWWPEAPTVHRFRQTLIPSEAGTIFDGRIVTERDPGTGVPSNDTCYFPDSFYDPAYSLEGGDSWIVNSGNIWAHDYVGWLPQHVNYYRDAGRAPCQTSIPQRMVINCGTNEVAYVDNSLRMGFDQLTVWSERAGVYQLRVWP